MFHYAKPQLTKKNLKKAQNILLKTIEVIQNEGIPYHLEGGTLLGIVRDNDLLPWDYDVDISIPKQSAIHFMERVAPKLKRKGYKVSTRLSPREFGPIKKGELRLFKVKSMFYYILNWFFPFTSKNTIALDVFIKSNDENYTYWEAMDKVMRVSNKYYESNETITYLGRELSVPNHYKDYLTEKYGDWSIPVKEWRCGDDEKTICS
jgi:phosphorylcholine metabolism protein LicD